MTQGRDGISLAHRAALRCPAIARQLSVVTLVVSVVALVAGTAGTSYAKKDRKLEDTVVVSNFGVLFGGSVETFAVGSITGSAPIRKIKGFSTDMSSANGAAGVAQSSSIVDGNEIAVGITAGLPAPPFVIVGGAPVACPTDCHINPLNGLCSPRTQYDCVTTTSPGTVLTFTKGANGDSAPATVIDGGFAEILHNTVGGLAVPVLLNNTGLFATQGVAYNNPFASTDNASAPVVEGPDILAVANLAPVIVGSTTDFITCGVTTLPTIGTITEYEFGDTGNVAPIPRLDSTTSLNTIFKVPVPPSTANPPNPPSDLPIPYFGNASIGGCNTFLFLPVGLAFDKENDLWVVNTGVHIASKDPVTGLPVADIVIPPFVSEFDPNAATEGDPSPINLIGLFGPTAGAFSTPLFITVGLDPSGATADKFIFVTDAGSPPFECDSGDHVGAICNNFQDNLTCKSPGGSSGKCTPPAFVPPSIKIFDVSGRAAVQTGAIVGGKTSLSHPTGIALSGDDLYVASQTSNQILMFDDFSTSGGNISPKVKIHGHQSGLDFPVGVALPEFTAPVLTGAN